MQGAIVLPGCRPVDRHTPGREACDCLGGTITKVIIGIGRHLACVGKDRRLDDSLNFPEITGIVSVVSASFFCCAPGLNYVARIAVGVVIAVL